MLLINIDPFYKDIHVRQASLPRDSEQLLDFQRENIHHPLWTFQPQQATNDSTWQVLLKLPAYNAYIISHKETPLFALELMPMSEMEYSTHYDEEPGDYWLRLNPLSPTQPEEVLVSTLKASINGIFVCTGIRRLIAPLHFSPPGNPLRQILEMAGFVILKEHAGMGSTVIYGKSGH